MDVLYRLVGGVRPFSYMPLLWHRTPVVIC